MNPSGNCISGPSTCGSTNIGSGELAAISIASKIPEFWTEMPRVWFAQFETMMAPQKQGDEAKYGVVIAKLGKEAVRQATDIIIAPPATNKYEAIKERLLSVYEESEERQFQKLVSEIELGDQKPSHLLRRMRDLARNNHVSEKTLHSLWMSRLPDHGAGETSVVIIDVAVGGVIIIAVAALVFFCFKHCRKIFYKKIFRHIDGRPPPKPTPVPTVSMRCSQHPHGDHGPQNV